MNTTTFCEDCKTQFTTVNHFKRHLLSNSHKLRTSSEKNNLAFCSCSKSFTTRSALYRHRKNCSVYINTKNTRQIPPHEKTLQLLKENQEMREEMDELRKQVETLMARGTGNTTSNSNIKNQTNIGNQYIVVNSFGNENIEHLTDQIVCKLIQAGPFTCLPKIIERIHFDPEHPENHNIKVTNQKNNYAKIVKDNKWVTANKKQAIDTMIQNGYGLLEEKYQDNKDTISEFKQERFEDFQEKYADQDKDLMKTIKDEVDIALLNGTGKLHKM